MGKRRKHRRLIQFILVIGTGCLVLSLWATHTWQTWMSPVGGSARIRVEIAKGTSSNQIGDQLQQVGLIRSSLAWKVWARFAATGSFQAGIYDLDPNQGLPQLAEQLQKGQTAQIPITIPEGWRINQMADAFEARNWFPATVFKQIAQTNVHPHLEWLPTSLNSLEGYLFPDTYQVPLSQLKESLTATAKAEAMASLMLDQFAQSALPLYRQNQASQSPTSLSLHEWVTLASIVEKEAVAASERELIAGVFMRRLKLRIPLGSDPTVEYAFNLRQTADRRLTFDQVKAPSPYNTYVNVGLPPGAIASPGLASLQATLKPTETDYLFFVARYDGTHVFSKTLKEHEAAQLSILRDRAKKPTQSVP